MSPIKVRHLVARGGAYYFQATPAMRRAGIFSEALGEDLAKAVARAQGLNAEWDRARRGEAPGQQARHGTISWLVAQYQRSTAYLSLEPKTQRSVDFYMGLLEAKIGDKKAAAFTPDHVKKFREREAAAVSSDHAWRLIKELRKLFGVARDKNLRPDNPAAGLRLPGQATREVVWTKTDLAIFIATADALGRASIGTAALLMYDLGQSPIDARIMTWATMKGAVFRFRRSKVSKLAARKGKVSTLIEVPATQRLLARLTKLREANRDATQIVISEETALPYKEDDFNHWCARIRWAADIPTEMRMIDLRRSRVVHLAEQEATVPEISAVTGHSIHTTERILERYLPRTGKMAASAIAKGESDLR